MGFITPFVCVTLGLTFALATETSVNRESKGIFETLRKSFQKECFTFFGATKCPDGSCVGPMKECPPGANNIDGDFIWRCDAIYEKRCPTGECMVEGKRCPGSDCLPVEKDCADGTCVVLSYSCPEDCGYKSCGWNSGHCFSESQECDGWEDCMTGQDEKECGNKIQFQNYEVLEDEPSLFERYNISWHWVVIIIPAVVMFFISITACACKVSRTKARNAVPEPGPLQSTNVRLPPVGHHNPLASESESVQNLDAYEAAIPTNLISRVRSDGYAPIADDTGALVENAMNNSQGLSASANGKVHLLKQSDFEYSRPPPTYNEALNMSRKPSKKNSPDQVIKKKADPALPSYETAMRCEKPRIQDV